MKKYFTTGLVILLPIVFTFMIVEFLVNFLTKPFLDPTIALLTELNIFQLPFSVLNEITLLTFMSKTLILFFLISFIILIGLLGKLFLLGSLFRFGNYLLHRVPFVNKIYKACQDVVQSLFSSSSKTFSQVVLVPFPDSQSLSVGLITGEGIQLKHNRDTQNLISVFVPGTPNPSVGFMLILKREQLIFVNMKVDEAMKFIVSCGVVLPNFTTTQHFPSIYEQQLSSESHLLSGERQHS